jgi:prevent-host-death family protein
MPAVGIREFKARASHYVELACSGQEVTITKRGRALARLVGEPRRRPSLRDRLAPLAAEGLIRLPALGKSPRPADLVPVGGKPVSELIIEDRR